MKVMHSRSVLASIKASIAASASHPDAVLIRACEAHPMNLEASNGCKCANHDSDDCLAWLAYSHTRDIITEAEPETMDGLLVKARASRIEADPKTGGGMDTEWDPQIVDDLLRLFGERDQP